MIKVWNYKEIVELYDQGLSGSRIKEKLKLDIGVRQIQRIGAERGNRSKHYNPPGRMQDDHAFVNGLYRPIIEQLMIENGQDPHVCTLCGNRDDNKKMTIHHTKYDGATINDLVFACWGCQNQFNNRNLE